MVSTIKSVQDFEALLAKAGGRLVVVDFAAAWCGPCKQIAPELKKLAAAQRDVVFAKVDVDDVHDLATKYNITAMPTFVFLKNGIEVGRQRGAHMPGVVEMVNKNK